MSTNKNTALAFIAAARARASPAASPSQEELREKRRDDLRVEIGAAERSQTYLFAVTNEAKEDAAKAYAANKSALASLERAIEECAGEIYIAERLTRAEVAACDLKFFNDRVAEYQRRTDVATAAIAVAMAEAKALGFM